jgi:hypothetical protein
MGAAAIQSFTGAAPINNLSLQFMPRLHRKSEIISSALTVDADVSLIPQRSARTPLPTSTIFFPWRLSTYIGHQCFTAVRLKAARPFLQNIINACYALTYRDSAFLLGIFCSYNRCHHAWIGNTPFARTKLSILGSYKMRDTAVGFSSSASRRPIRSTHSFESHILLQCNIGSSACCRCSCTVLKYLPSATPSISSGRPKRPVWVWVG